MKIRATKSFSGSVSMSKGEVIDCKREEVVNDLLNAGYVELVEQPDPGVKTADVEQPDPGVKTADVEPPDPGVKTADVEQPDLGVKTADVEQPESEGKTGDAVKVSDGETPRKGRKKQVKQ